MPLQGASSPATFNAPGDFLRPTPSRQRHDGQAALGRWEMRDAAARLALMGDAMMRDIYGPAHSHASRNTLRIEMSLFRREQNIRRRDRLARASRKSAPIYLVAHLLGRIAFSTREFYQYAHF